MYCDWLRLWLRKHREFFRELPQRILLRIDFLSCVRVEFLACQVVVQLFFFYSSANCYLPVLSELHSPNKTCASPLLFTAQGELMDRVAVYGTLTQPGTEAEQAWLGGDSCWKSGASTSETNPQYYQVILFRMIDRVRLLKKMLILK